jgi:hypothetical protein
MTSTLADDLAPPTADLSNGDVWQSLAKATVSALPVFGPAVAELYQLAISSPAQKRQAQWQISVSEVIKRLLKEVDGLKIENLANNAEFVTTVIAVSQIAMKTSQADKIKMLQAAIYSCGSGLKLKGYIQNTFFQIIDRYVPEHIALLKAFTEDELLKLAFERLKKNQPDAIGKNTEKAEV